MLFQSDRRFKLWDYNVSHNQLLLRSPRTPDVPDNIDIIFWGVRVLAIPTILTGIEIREECGDHMKGTFCIESAGRRSSIVADGLKVVKNQLDIFESSLVYFNEADSTQPAGETLAHS